MWKLISLSALLIVGQAANISDFYGDWIKVAFYRISGYLPACIHFTFAKSTENGQCIYADGRNATTVKFSIMTVAGEIIRLVPVVPVIAVDTVAEVMPALNISCRCGDKDIRDRAVARLVNENFFILYNHVKESSRIDTEPNAAILFAREVVSAQELQAVISSIEDLKNRRAASMCGKENYGSDNKVL